ncbi:MAG: ATP-binding protein, partial [Planctomycetes bacterium]|nr:ATP-binding protein [Planctomycetota bacterium]
TQRDVREVQLAKAAIRTGIDLLLAANDRPTGDIDQVIIAGAFGTYIDVPSAIAIGMLPELPLDRFRQVGNAAGMGAKLVLLSQNKRAEARALGNLVRYMELASDPRFNSTFVQATWLG